MVVRSTLRLILAWGEIPLVRMKKPSPVVCNFSTWVFPAEENSGGDWEESMVAKL